MKDKKRVRNPPKKPYSASLTCLVTEHQLGPVLNAKKQKIRFITEQEANFFLCCVLGLAALRRAGQDRLGTANNLYGSEILDLNFFSHC